MKSSVLLLLILAQVKLIAQDSEKLELSLGGNFSFPISEDAGNFYLVGGSAVLGYFISPLVVFGGSFNYYSTIFKNDSPENVSSLMGISANIKTLFLSNHNSFNPYMKFDLGFFIPFTGDGIYSIFPELGGCVGVEFLMDRRTFLFIDTGCLWMVPDYALLFFGRVGVNFHI
jgi:hypothetical protein